MGKPLDLAAVREGRERLACLVREHPELTSPAAQARLAAHLADPALTLESDRQTIVDMATAERHAVNIRLDPALVKALDAAAEVAPVLSRHAICRAALHIGLSAVVQDPTLLLKPPEMRANKRSKRAK